MEYSEWLPYYESIRSEFGFPFDREQASADRLRALLGPTAREDPLGRIGRRLRGRPVVVVGLAPRAGAPPVWRLPVRGKPPALVAADGAAAVCLEQGLVPEVIVTDLDGPIPSEVTANARGALVLVHAHGDNGPALDAWVPEFRGELAGSWAGPPGDGLLNVGGFTDGDRSVCLAESVGAERILLWGFDFDAVEERDPSERARKLAKLRWARTIVDTIARRARVPIDWWSRDGSIAPYRVVPTGPATQ